MVIQLKTQLAVVSTLYFSIICSLIAIIWMVSDPPIVKTDTNVQYDSTSDSRQYITAFICSSASVPACSVILVSLQWLLMAISLYYVTILSDENVQIGVTDFQRMAFTSITQCFFFALFCIGLLMASTTSPSMYRLTLAVACLGSSSSGLFQLKFGCNYEQQQNEIQPARRSPAAPPPPVAPSPSPPASQLTRSGESPSSLIENDMVFEFVRQLRVVEILTPIGENTETLRSRQNSTTSVRSRSSENNQPEE